MFEKLKLTEWILEDFGSELGLVKANYDYLKDNQVANVFTKNKELLEVVQIGNLDFDELDAFIKKAMNSFYTTLNDGTIEEIDRKKSDYKHLYEIWHSILIAKNNHSSNIDDLYRDLIFALHMMGYKK